MTVNQKITALAVATIGDEDDPPADTIPFCEAVQRLHTKFGATESEVAMWMFLHAEVLRGWIISRGRGGKTIGGRIFAGERTPSTSVLMAVRWIIAHDVHLSAAQVDALVVDDDDRWIDFKTAEDLVSKKAQNVEREKEIIQTWRGVHKKMTDIDSPTLGMPDKVSVIIPFGNFARNIEDGLVMRKQFESFLKRQALSNKIDVMATFADDVVDRSGRSVALPTKTTIDLLREAGDDPVVGLHYRAEITLGRKLWMDDNSRLSYDAEIAGRFKLGRYTLCEAVQFILENEEMGIDAASMLTKLEQDVKNGMLACYPADHIDKWAYADGARVRPWYLECYWNDLNLWLDEREKRIMCRFPDPSKQLSTSVLQELPTIAKPVSISKSARVDVHRVEDLPQRFKRGDALRYELQELISGLRREKAEPNAADVIRHIRPTVQEGGVIVGLKEDGLYYLKHPGADEPLVLKHRLLHARITRLLSTQ
jgi:hypothetical protein